MANSPQITINGPEPLVLDPSETRKRPLLNQDEARLLTAEIQRTTARLWILVTEAHDRGAHFALGYKSWDDYVRGELRMSPSRSYQLLDTGHVMRELAIGGLDVEQVSPPPARIVARVKGRLPEVRRIAKAAAKSGEQPDLALRRLAREPVRGEVIGHIEPLEPMPTGKVGDGRANAQLTCPACEGSGKVSRSLAGRLRSFLK